MNLRERSRHQIRKNLPNAPKCVALMRRVHVKKYIWYFGLKKEKLRDNTNEKTNEKKNS